MVFETVLVLKAMDDMDDFALSSLSLWPQVLQTTQHALKSGALRPIETQACQLSDGSLEFTVRVVDNIARKESVQRDREKQPSDKRFNPFLPYEEALFVANLSDTHLCLLNKFNVVDHHLLIVTRQYESQNEWLTETDFEALAHGLWEIPGLGFYNGGKEAGASQHHKHLQLIPYSSHLTEPPMSSFIERHHKTLEAHARIPALPFFHSIRLLTRPWHPDNSAETACKLFETYRQVMMDLEIDLETAQPNVSYNLLVTRDWMMGVRRSRGSYQDIGVNSLGYAGWLLVKNQADLIKLKHIGPMNLLRVAGHPIPNVCNDEEASP